MAKDKQDELEKKKRQLEQELKQIQNELDDSIIQVRNDLSSRLDPKTFIRKYPLPVVGASVLLGFLFSQKRSKNGTDNSDSEQGEISKTLISEVKKLATRKALSFASDYVENLLNRKREEFNSENSTNGPNV